MKTLMKSAMIGALLAAGASGTAFAQSAASAPASPIIQGIAVASLDAVVANASAIRTGQQQRTTTYKAQYDAAEARRKALADQIKPMIDRYNAAAGVAKPDQAALQAQGVAIQQFEQNGQQELQRMLRPVALSEAYVQEQVEEKLDQAVKTAMTKKRISLLLNPQAIVAVQGNAYNLNQDILNELNTLIPAAQLVPPQGWLPREVREAQAQQAAQQAAPAAAGTTPAPAPASPQGR